MSVHHSFSTDFAALYGVNEAILIHHFQFWITFNRRLKRNIREGRCWTYQTRREIQAHFPYWNFEKVRRICENLVKLKVLITGKFNKNPIDKTLWYAFADEEAFQVDENSIKSYERQNCHTKGKIATPIPDNKSHIVTGVIDSCRDCKSNDSSDSGEAPGQSLGSLPSHTAREEAVAGTKRAKQPAGSKETLSPPQQKPSQRPLAGSPSKQKYPLMPSQRPLLDKLTEANLGATEETLTIIIRENTEKKLKDCLVHLENHIAKGGTFKNSKIAFFRNALKDSQVLVDENTVRNRQEAKIFIEIRKSALELHEKYVQCPKTKKDLPLNMPNLDEFIRALHNLDGINRRFP
jgi:hypothetical protein